RCRRLARSGLRADAAAQAQGVGVLAEGGNAKGDMFLETNAQFFGASADVVAADPFSKGFIFQAAFDGINLEIEDAFRRAYIGARSQKAGQLVAGKQRVLQSGLSRDVAIVGVRKDGPNDLLGVGVLAQDLRALSRVSLVWKVLKIRPALIVKV